MKPYVATLIDFLKFQGFECRVRDWSGDDNEASLKILYETESGDEIVVHILCSDEFVFLSAVVEEEIGFDEDALEYMNSLNLKYWDYSFVIDDDEDLMIERTKELDEWENAIFNTQEIVHEIKAISECCAELQNS